MFYFDDDNNNKCHQKHEHSDHKQVISNYKGYYEVLEFCGIHCISNEYDSNNSALLF